MKISKDNVHTINNNVDIMALIEKFQEEFEEVYWNTIENITFIYRPLGRLEYKQIISSDIEDIEKEDVVCKACLLYPKDFDFDNCAAGIPTYLFNKILRNSFLDKLESKKLILAYHRAEMEEFDNQITCIINEAFPNIDLEEIENWGMSKTAKYLSRAEWKLNVLRQIPVDYEISDKLMENEWITQHNLDVNEEEEKHQPVSEQTQPGVIIGESIEERQKRLAKDGVPKKSKEDLERLRKAFPDINWDAKVDTDPVNDVVDTVAPALRPGW